MTKLCARPIDGLSEILGDRVAVWRRKNLAAILQEGGEYARSTQLSLKEIPLKALLPLLEGASVEEEPMLRTLWARLLANASATGSSISACGIAGDLLKALSPSDAKLLDALYQEVHVLSNEPKGANFGNLNGISRLAAETSGDGPFRLISRSRLMEITGLSLEEFELCFDNITRFNVIEAPQRHDLDGRKLDLDHYAFTRLGWKVMNLLAPAPASAI